MRNEHNKQAALFNAYGRFLPPSSSLIFVVKPRVLAVLITRRQESSSYSNAVNGIT
jgi:hypothetical protein